LPAEAEAAYDYLRNAPPENKPEARKDWIPARDESERARMKAQANRKTARKPRGSGKS
jgi:hypothetical protein